MRTSLIVAALLISAWAASEAKAIHPSPYHYNNCTAAMYASSTPWHRGYYHTQWGQPVALVVPPTAELRTSWAWGVTNTNVRPIWHQFERPWPGPYDGGYGFSPTPLWPSHTDQFGVYYVRGPW